MIDSTKVGGQRLAVDDTDVGRVATADDIARLEVLVEIQLGGKAGSSSRVGSGTGKLVMVEGRMSRMAVALSSKGIFGMR